MRNEDENVSSFSDRPEMEMSGSSDVHGFSGPVNSSAASAASVLNYRNSSFVKKKAKFNLSPSVKCTDDDSFVEVTIDIQADSVAVHGVQSAAGGDRPPDEDPEIAPLARRTLEKKSSFRPSLLQSTSSRIKHVSVELKRFASLSRRQSTPRFDRNKSAATHALKGLKFIAANTGGDAGWPSVNKRFDELTASTNGLLPSSLFGECIGMNRDCKEFAGELFRALAQRRHISGDSISKTQLREFWERIADDSFDSRLQTFFDMVDRDADGRITEEEVEEIICLSASANKLSNIQKQAKEYASLIMEELDPGKQGYIMVYNLETLLIQAPNQSVRVSDTRVLSQMLSQKLMPSPENNPLSRWYEMSKYFLLDNWQRVWVIMLWLGIMAGLFAYKFVQYRNKAAFQVMGYCVSFAKGGAETLKFNMALILLPVCRNTITWLRNETKLGRVVPFDDNLNFHKVIALGIAAGIGLHAGAHLACDFPRLLSANAEKYEPMIQYFGEQPTSYWWFVKGVEGVTGVVMVVLMAIAFTLASPWFRRNKLSLPKPLHKLTGFNAFWYSHHLFFIVYALLIVHGIKLYLTKIWYQKTTWMYLAVPVLIYATERLIREFRSSIEAVEILKVAVYPGNVLALHMSKPRAFKYKSGQYMFINCAAVSPFEWHPFSITSAPDDDFLSLHIRTLGDWTGRLKAVFSEVCQRSAAGKSGLLRAEFGGGRNSGPEFPKIRIDGPYGAPAQDYKKYEVVLLVGLGIGATPMISIVKDIIDNIKCPEVEAAHAVESGTAAASSPTGAQKKTRNGKGFGTRKAYFYWVTREQGSFEWFKEIMNEVAEMDEKHTIELHNYCTSVYEEGDARSALIAMLQSLHHAKNGVDVVSGTRVKSHFAKPNLREVFKKIALQHPDSKIGVFYCGGPGLMKELRQLASDFSHKTSTKFEFHKENF